jgi:hypothetical protein
VVEQHTAYPVDVELGGQRLFVPFIFIALWIIGYFVFAAIIPGAGLNLIAIALGFGVAYGVTTLAERMMKQRWPSTRAVIVADDGVRLMRKGKLEQEMRADQPINQIWWRFTISRRSRVSKGWYMLACALEHEDNYLTVYTFVPPKEFEQFHRAQAFPQLATQKEPSRKTDLRLAGEQRRLRDAERHRWIHGAEMSADDFKRFVEEVHSRFPEWTPIQ